MDKRVLLSIQRCLLEKITPNLRSVYAFEDEGIKKLIFCYDKSPSEEEQELASVAVTEFISDFPDDDIAYEVCNVPSPSNTSSKVPDKSMCVFQRYEPSA